MTEDAVLQTLLDARHLLCAGLWPVLRDRHTIEDILQNTIVRALQDRENLRDPQHALAWARVVARRQALNHLQRHQARIVTLDADVLEQLETDWEAEDHEALRERAEALRCCVERLPQRSRALVEMRYHEGCDGRQIGARVRMSVDAVYKAIQRIHEALRDCVNGELREAT